MQENIEEIEYIELVEPILLKKFLAKQPKKNKVITKEIDELFEIPIGKDNISRIRTGVKRNIFTDNLIKLCVVLDCTPNDLLANPLRTDGKWQQ